MSFTDRTLSRALGVSGRIQPWISPVSPVSPVSGSDPWVTADTASELEVVDEHEVAREHGSRPMELQRAVRPAPQLQQTLRPAPQHRSVVRDPRVDAEVFESHIEIGDREVFAEGDPTTAAAEVRRGRIEAASEPGLEVAITTEREVPQQQSEVRSFRAKTLTESSPTRSSWASVEAEPAVVESTTISRGSEARAGRGLVREASPNAAWYERVEDAPVVPSALEREPAAHEASSALAVAAMRVDRRSPTESIVRIEIGKVEVRAAPPPPDRARSDVGIPKPTAFVSLQQYLQKPGGS